VLIRLTAVAIAVSFLGAGCGGSSRRHAVAQYIDGVNAIELKLAPQLLEVSRANRDLVRPHPKLNSVLQRLHRAGAHIRVLSRRLAALPAPQEAQRLRTLLVQLLGRQQAAIREVERMAVFIPAFNHALQPLVTSDTILKRELRQKTSPGKKAEAPGGESPSSRSRASAPPCRPRPRPDFPARSRAG
jgi:hypothetical protein